MSLICFTTVYCANILENGTCFPPNFEQAQPITAYHWVQLRTIPSQQSEIRTFGNSAGKFWWSAHLQVVASLLAKNFTDFWWHMDQISNGPISNYFGELLLMDKILHHQGWWLSPSQVVVWDFVHQQYVQGSIVARPFTANAGGLGLGEGR